MILLSEKELDYLNILSELDKNETNIVMDPSTFEWIQSVSRKNQWESPSVLLYDDRWSTSPTIYYLREEKLIEP